MKRFLVVFALSFSAVVHAQDPSPTAERATSFEAVEGQDTEAVNGFALMVGAYGLLLAFVGLYVARLGRVEARLAADVERLEKRLAEGERGA